MSTLFHNIPQAAAGAMEIPVVICLLLLAFSVFSLGWRLAKLPGERRHMNASLPRLLETMRSGSGSRRASPAARIWKSGVRCTMMPRPAPITSSPMRRGTDPWRS